MGKYMLLKQAAEVTGHPEYRLRQWCLQRKIRFNMAGNRYIINTDWLDEDLQKIAAENLQHDELTVVECRKLRKI